MANSSVQGPVETDPTTDQAAPAAEIRFDTRRWRLTAGAPLLLGSGPTCQVRVGDGPRPDPLVLPTMAELTLWGDRVLVRNVSSTQAVVVRVNPGPERVVEPGEVFAPARARFDLVLLGNAAEVARGSVEYVISVDAAAVTPPAPTIDLTQPAVAPGSSVLTKADRRMLAALCEPVLLLGGVDAVPRTADQIAKRLSTSPGYVYNRLRQIRIRLSAQGVPGLLDERVGLQRAGDRDFAQPLAAWAVRSKVVTCAVVTSLLPPIDPEVDDPVARACAAVTAAGGPDVVVLPDAGAVPATGRPGA